MRMCTQAGEAWNCGLLDHLSDEIHSAVITQLNPPLCTWAYGAPPWFARLVAAPTYMYMYITTKPIWVVNPQHA